MQTYSLDKLNFIQYGKLILLQILKQCSVYCQYNVEYSLHLDECIESAFYLFAVAFLRKMRRIS